ncbi:DUF4910 domain-containing protein [Sedimentibacter hydroxybenzoicus DSM 7310]|uniref:DUF4910 domain-containing protein n=1 Tax=Sedimentibacter hydroxybenzoicus DSM 7310 TaxID=1123245 RepID=A0A974BGZ4_SEDHY|nr:DUF4910 domain-containing protein [Sedimentibacter hydroxybenzoicus]NYB73009.1 DUF4910 domain-containing protein [Sedimentibacter hydroxybenzoicus DSM 7310]
MIDEMNFTACIDVIKNTCNGHTAMDYIRKIKEFHRIQASEGYRNSAKCVADLLRSNGVHVSISKYPADGQTLCFTQKLFKEWNCQEGWLEITAPWQQRLSDFNQEEMSIIQRSSFRDFSNKDVPIIYADYKSNPDDFDISLEGALLFVENSFESWIERSTELGAAGIITVSMPEIAPVRINMSEDIQMSHAHANLSFHILSKYQEDKLCGFAISPLNGKRLREACIKLKDEGKRPTARFKVSSVLKEGAFENVDAVIPGFTDEEILMVAHLCHPRSSVNDNASGVAAAVEAMCSLNNLIENGKLPRPKRSIRLLLIPEFTGLYAYLNERENNLSNIVSGINLDMVGAYQNKDAGGLIIVDTPDCARSFSGDIATNIVDELLKECKFGRNGIYAPLFLSTKVPFVGGSDHYILSDPAIGIPSIAVTQWPDKTYHTSVDSIEHIDPNMLQRAAVLSAAYCYIYSRFNLSDAEMVVEKVSERFLHRFMSIRQKGSDAEIKEHSNYIKGIYYSTLDNILCLMDEDCVGDVLQIIKKEKELFSKLQKCFVKDAEAAEINKTKDSSSSKVPVRLFKAPIAMRSVLSDMTAKQRNEIKALRKRFPEFGYLDDYIIFEIDGKKTSGQISRCIYFQTGTECEDYVEEFLKIFFNLKYIGFKF